MKTIFNALTIALFVLITHTSCQAQKKIKGNGNTTTQTIKTQDYNAIKVVGFMDVFLETGEEGTITVTTDENLHNYITVEVNQGKLSIGIKKGVTLKTKKGITVTVPVTHLNAISLVGSGDILSKQPLNASTMEITLTGSGDIQLALEAKDVDVKIVGSGDVKVVGSTSNLEVKLSGSGDFVGTDLISENTQAYVSGSGDIKVYTTSNLKARVNGSGDIVYRGNPATISSKVIGSGDIIGN